LRVSTKGQASDDKSGLHAQRTEIDEWLKTQEISKVTEEIIDAGLSAREFSQIQKGKLGKLLTRLKNSKRTAGSTLLIFALSDRFSRADTIQATNIFTGIILTGVDIAFCNLNIIISKDDDEMTRQMKLIQALMSFGQSSLEWQTKSKRMKGAWRKFRDEWLEYSNGNSPKPASNNLMQKPPWFHSLDKNKNITLHNKRAKYVRLIFDKYTKEGLSIMAIARFFNEELKIGRFSRYKRKQNIEESTAALKWTDSSIKFVLKHPAVIGQQRFQKLNRNEDGSKSSETIKLDNGEEAIVDGIYPPIISKEQFQAAQKLLQNNKSNSGNKQKKKYYPLNIFRGLMYDGYYGLAVNLSSAPKRYGNIFTYFRSVYSKSFGGTKIKPVAAKAFENAFFQLYQLNTTENPIIEVFNQLTAEDDSSKSIKLATKKEKLESLKKANSNLLDTIESEEDSGIRKQVLQRFKQNEEEQKKLEAELKVAKKKITKSNNTNFSETFRKLAKFTSDEKIRTKARAFFKSTEHKVYLYTTGFDWDERRFLKQFKKNFGKEFGMKSKWKNFDESNFRENPLAFVFEYAFLKCAHSIEGAPWLKDKFSCNVFEEFFGRYQNVPEYQNQNMVFYCNRPEDDDFCGVFSTTSHSKSKVKYLCDERLFWSRKITTKDNGSLKAEWPLLGTKPIRNVAMDKFNVAIAKFLYKSFKKSPFMDDGKVIAKTFPKGMRLHVFVRWAFGLLLILDDGKINEALKHDVWLQKLRECTGLGGKRPQQAV